MKESLAFHLIKLPLLNECLSVCLSIHPTVCLSRFCFSFWKVMLVKQTILMGWFGCCNIRMANSIYMMVVVVWLYICSCATCCMLIKKCYFHSSTSAGRRIKSVAVVKSKDNKTYAKTFQTSHSFHFHWLDTCVCECMCVSRSHSNTLTLFLDMKRNKVFN